jgi:hypothetical protein
VQQIWLCFLVVLLCLYRYIIYLIDTTYKKKVMTTQTNRKVITSTKESNHEIELWHNKDLFSNILLSLFVSIDVDYVDLSAKLQKFDSVKEALSECRPVALRSWWTSPWFDHFRRTLELDDTSPRCAYSVRGVLDFWLRQWQTYCPPSAVVCSTKNPTLLLAPEQATIPNPSPNRGVNYVFMTTRQNIARGRVN